MTNVLFYPDGNHTAAECKKLRQLQFNPSGRMGGRGRGTNKSKGRKGREKGKQTTSWNTNPSPKGKYGKGEKGKTQKLGSRKPKFNGECSHCGITGHMARDCYKRQQGTKPIPVKQLNTAVDSSEPSNSLLKPALIQFQQFPTFVKRKLEGTHYHEPDESSSPTQDTESHMHNDPHQSLSHC